jgi:hypothetical protein
MIVLPSVQAGIVGSKQFVFDTDAESYINRVIAADVAAGNSNGLEFTVKTAINTFILGLKEDLIWNNILSSCIMAGARTLNGAIISLKNNINPTNVGLNPATYSRKFGIRGPTSTQQPGGASAPIVYLNTNIKTDGSYIIGGTTNNSGGIAQNDIHISAYTDGGGFGGIDGGYIIGATSTANNSDVGLRPHAGTNSVFRVHNNQGTIDNGTTNTSVAGFAGANRDANGAIAYWTTANATPLFSSSIVRASTAPTTVKDIYVFNRNDATSVAYTNNFVKFYSIGQAIDMTKLNNRLNTFFNTLNTLVSF